MTVETADLATLLRQVKKKQMFFAFVAKGTEGTLLVDKKKIPNKDASEAKKECGGGIIYKGNCLYEDETYVFEISKEPPATLAGQIKKIIKRDASLTLRVVVRFNQALAEEGGDGQAGQEEDVPLGPPPLATRFAARLKALAPVLQAAEKIGGTLVVQARQRIVEGTKHYESEVYALANDALDHAEAFIKQTFAANQAPVAPTGQDPLALKFAGRLKALAPIIQRLEGINNTHAKDARLALNEANMYFRARKFAEANETLDLVEDLLKQAFAADNGTPANNNGAQQPNQDAARIAARLKTLAPMVLKAEGTGSDFAKQAKAQVATANQLYVAKQYQEANVALDTAEQLTKQAFADALPKPGVTAKEKVAKSLQVWADAKDQADAEINSLISALKRTGDAAMADIANGMGLTFSKFKVGLTTALMNFDASQGEGRRQAHSKVSTILSQYRQHLETDKFIAGADDNPFGIQVNIRRSMLAALVQVKANVDAAVL